MKVREAFPGFTTLFKHCRPAAGDAVVYEVDAGAPADPNLVMKASCFDDEKPVGKRSSSLSLRNGFLKTL